MFLIKIELKIEIKLLEGDKVDKESQYIYPDSQIGEIIDISLRMDKNKDGYIDFAEYRNAEENYSKP